MRKRSIFFRRMEKKRFMFPLSMCFVVILALNTVGSQLVSRARTGLISFTTASYEVLQNFSSKVSSIRYFFTSDINECILKLHQENQRLAYEIENLKHLQTENKELRKLLDLKENISDKVTIAKVTSVFSNDYIRSCVLNAGSEDGIEVDDIVRNKDGFIGRISEVHDKWSCVLTITDTNSKIPVKIGKERVNAIVSGDNYNTMSISMKNEDTSIKDGDIAETAYLENPICNQIPVGKVVEKHGTLFIEPFADFNSLHYVCILKNK